MPLGGACFSVGDVIDNDVFFVFSTLMVDFSGTSLVTVEWFGTRDIVAAADVCWLGLLETAERKVTH